MLIAARKLVLARAIFAEKLHVVVRSMDGYSLWHTNITISTQEFGGWQMMAGATESPPSLTSSETDLKMYLAVRGLDNRVYYNVWNDVGWTGWTVLTSGATCDGPGVTVLDAKLSIVVRGLDGLSLWDGWIDLIDNSFSGWTALDGATESAAPLTS